MKKIKIFISSVQKEFAKEREMLYEYLSNDALLGRFFEPFIFEKLPAISRQTNMIYLDEVHTCDIYIGLLGKEYGLKNEKNISPTECEFNEATKSNKIRLIFISQHPVNERDLKQQKFIKKIEKELIRKKFNSEDELKFNVYAALVKYLEEKAFIRTGPFDASICENANLDDLDFEKISEFVRVAKSKRGFPLSDQSSPEKILTHLNMIKEKKLTNAAVLLFAKQPQRFIISSEIKCAQFYGNEIAKPIPAYQVYKGDIFQLINQAVDFVLSRIDAAVGTRSENVQAPIDYEIPRAVISEAIVNAIAHRDYTSTGSVQIMLFHNRLEIWNPGQLPHNLTLEKIKQIHSSFPVNPLIAEPLYLAGYIERLGTGITDMLSLSVKAGLMEPYFIQSDVFKIIILRKNQPVKQATGQPTGQATGQPIKQEIEYIKRVVLVLSSEIKRSEIQDALDLRHRESFMENYLTPAIESGYIEMTHPDNPNHPHQKYRLTEKGKKLKARLIIENKKLL